MEDIRTPPRLDSLNPFTIQIIIHLEDKTKTIEFTDVFPFETLYNLKQRITTRQIQEKEQVWLPNQMFIAEEEEGKDNEFVPLEYEWEFKHSFLNPYDKTVLGKPVKELYRNGERVPITPSLFSGITLEARLKKQRTVHVWNIIGVANAIGFKPTDDIDDAVFFGFLFLYFPFMTKDEFTNEKVDDTVFEILETPRDLVVSRYKKLDQVLKETEKTNPPILGELLDLHYFQIKDLRSLSPK
jgi:hypothetical protein